MQQFYAEFRDIDVRRVMVLVLVGGLSSFAFGVAQISGDEHFARCDFASFIRTFPNNQGHLVDDHLTDLVGNWPVLADGLQRQLHVIPAGAGLAIAEDSGAHFANSALRPVDSESAVVGIEPPSSAWLADVSPATLTARFGYGFANGAIFARISSSRGIR